jgi:hypothetical protein
MRKYLVPALLVMLGACHSSDEQRVENGSEYFPLQTGNSWTYDVSEIAYDTAIQNKKVHYQEKFEIADKFSDHDGNDTYVIYRSTRASEAASWTYIETWSAKISDLNELIVSEGDVPYIKILLPVHDGLSWKGNKYNTIEASRSNGRIDNFTITDYQKPFDDHANTLTVTESNDINLSYKDVRYSVYAKDLGLVYAVNNYVEFCDDDSCFGLNLRKHEVTKIKTLIDHVLK